MEAAARGWRIEKLGKTHPRFGRSKEGVENKRLPRSPGPGRRVGVKKLSWSHAGRKGNRGKRAMAQEKGNGKGEKPQYPSNIFHTLVQWQVDRTRNGFANSELSRGPRRKGPPSGWLPSSPKLEGGAIRSWALGGGRQSPRGDR